MSPCPSRSPTSLPSVPVGSPAQAGLCHPSWGHHPNATTLHGDITSMPSLSMGSSPHCHHHPWGHHPTAITIHGDIAPWPPPSMGAITPWPPPSMGLPFVMGPSPHCHHHPRGHHPTANTLHGAAVLHGAVTSLPSLSMEPSLSVGPSPHCHPLRDDITLPTPCPHSSQGIWTGCPHRVPSKPTVLHVPMSPPHSRSPSPHSRGHNPRPALTSLDPSALIPCPHRCV